MSAIFSFSSLITVLLLLICTTTFLRLLRPTIFDTPVPLNPDGTPGPIPTLSKRHKGLSGFCWKLSRIGERLSPFVSVACVAMAAHILLK
mmetsp:Transcript_2927/g.5991  ORF Transcript_2927/g.5991 Transcript_2927/m.5991 type:complete len:90 (+) Transcript_2927:36-305(+)